MFIRKSLWVCGIAVALGSGVGARSAETEKSKGSSETTETPAAESPTTAVPEEPKPVSRILPLPASVDKRLADRLEKFLRVYGEVSVDPDRHLVFIQCQPQYLPEVESLIAGFDQGPQPGYLLRLVWLQDGIEGGGHLQDELQPVVDRLKRLGLGEVGMVGQLVLRVSKGAEFNTAMYPLLGLDAASLSFNGRLNDRMADSVEIKIFVKAGVGTSERPGRSRRGNNSGTVAGFSTMAKFKIGNPAIVSVTPYGAGSAVFVLEVITAS